MIELPQILNWIQYGLMAQHLNLCSKESVEYFNV